MSEYAPVIFFLGALLAMLASNEPKRSAISVCVTVAWLGVVLNTLANNEILDSAMVFPLYSAVEFLGAMVILDFLKGLREKRDRDFMFYMSGLLVASAALNSIYIFIYMRTELLTFDAYTVAFQTIASIHVLLMLANADGLTNAFRSFRDSVNRYRGGSISSRISQARRLQK